MPALRNVARDIRLRKSIFFESSKFFCDIFRILHFHLSFSEFYEKFNFKF